MENDRDYKRNENKSPSLYARLHWPRSDRNSLRVSCTKSSFETAHSTDDRDEDRRDVHAELPQELRARIKAEIGDCWIRSSNRVKSKMETSCSWFDRYWMGSVSVWSVFFHVHEWYWARRTHWSLCGRFLGGWMWLRSYFLSCSVKTQRNLSMGNVGSG